MLGPGPDLIGPAVCSADDDAGRIRRGWMKQEVDR